MHHSSISCEINLLYFFRRNFTQFLQKELIKVQNLKRNSTAQVKFHQIWTLIGSFCWKYTKFQLKKYRGVMFHGAEYWCKVWRKTDLCFHKWHKKFGKFSPEHVRKSKNLDFYWVFLSKVEHIWASNLQGSYLSWEWRIMQNLNRNLLVSSKLTWGI